MNLYQLLTAKPYPIPVIVEAIDIITDPVKKLPNPLIEQSYCSHHCKVHPVAEFDYNSEGIYNKTCREVIQRKIKAKQNKKALAELNH